MFNLNRNPFTTEYLKEEVEFYGGKEYNDNGITVKLEKGRGVLSDYLNKAYRIGEVDFPILRIDKRLWMSLSWMEVQSAFPAIEIATGEVGLGGLGLGYAPLRIAHKEDVDFVDVYEIDPRVIKYFLSVFSDRPELKKINIIEGDARDKLKDKYYDYVFMDIYDTMLSDEMLDDITWFIGNNDIQTYNFWCKEKISLALLMRYHRAREEEDEELMGEWFYSAPMFDRLYFKKWIETEVEGVEGAMLVDMYDEVYDEEYLLQARDLFNEYYL